MALLEAQSDAFEVAGARDELSNAIVLGSIDFACTATHDDGGGLVEGGGLPSLTQARLMMHMSRFQVAMVLYHI